MHERVGRDVGRHTANRLIQLLRAVIFWATDAGMFSSANPARRIKLFREPRRKRFLGPDELAKFFGAVATEKNTDFRDYVLLALWTGARKSDVMSMRWQDVFLEDNRWHIQNPKGRRSLRCSANS